METYDDRPVSMYDNLNTPTSTPKSKTPATSTSATKTTLSPTTTTTTNGATNSPYADISFKFNDNKNAQQPQQQQQLHLLPTSNRNFNTQAANTMIANPSSSPDPSHSLNTGLSSNNYTYATPFKPAIQTAIQSPPPPAAAAASLSPTPAQTATSIAKPLRATSASSTIRPLSQHSQSDLNEATSQSIAAVKAALHDAKSKFFGLNGYAAAAATAHDDAHNENTKHNNSNNTFSESPNKSQQPLLYDPNSSDAFNTSTHHRPKVQILTPPPKPQPKYQNIPENSAIFRNLTPPERPPKPIQYQEPFVNGSNTSAIDSALGQQTPVRMSTTQYPSTSTNNSPGKSLPYTNYKQIPLNDLEATSPSQAVYMSTTVPQNIKGTKIAGRHTPTRNSLRHSRMLVINNKNYQGIQHPNPMNFRHPNLARWLLILQVAIGCLLSCVAIWIFLLAPNTAIQDNPYWSGLALLLAGIFGLILIRYRRIKRQKLRENCFLFLRADSYVLALAAVLLCCVAMIFAAIHFARLMADDTTCESSNILLEHASCLCTFNTPRSLLRQAPTNITIQGANHNAIWLSDGEPVIEDETDFVDHSYKVKYNDLSCKEVTCEWTMLLGISMSLNALGLFVSFVYIVLLACQRYDSKRLYTSVHTSTF